MNCVEFLLGGFNLKKFLNEGVNLGFESDGKNYEIRLVDGLYEIIGEDSVVFQMDSYSHLEGYMLMVFPDAKMLEKPSELAGYTQDYEREVRLVLDLDDF